MSRLLKSVGVVALALASCLALAQSANAGWDFQRTPVWSSGHGGYTSAYSSGYSNGYSGYSGSYAPSYAPSYPSAAPGFTYAAPSYAYVPPVSSGTVSAQQVNVANDRAVRIDVRVPAGAKIWIGGKETTQGGESRSFVSPPLEPGSDYTYDIRATWKEGGRTVERKRHVTVHAGDRLNLNLSSPSRPTTPVTSSGEGE